HAAAEAGIRISPIPGASALLAALVASGLDVGRFTFFGFLARKGAERRSALEEIAAAVHVVVLYEAANRVADTLVELAQAGAADRGAPAVRRRRRLVRESLEHSESARGHPRADVAARGAHRGARHADGRQALGLPVSAHDRAREREAHGRRGRAPA